MLTRYYQLLPKLEQGALIKYQEMKLEWIQNSDPPKKALWILNKYTKYLYSIFYEILCLIISAQNRHKISVKYLNLWNVYAPLYQASYPTK